MTKKTWLKVAGMLAVTSIATVALAADHLDAPATKLDAAGDINDVYSFVDNGRVVLVMTVFPAAIADSKFSDKTQYIFHTTSGGSFNEAKASLDIVCTFDAAQAITCKAGAGAGMPVTDMVTGDASTDAGLESDSKAIKVFAGLRKDPFFFNLAGFNAVAKTVTDLAAMNPPVLTFDMAGCPAIDAANSALLVNQLKSDDPAGPAKDFFATLNGMAIVLSLDKALVTDGGKNPIVSIWGSTNKAM